MAGLGEHVEYAGGKQFELAVRAQVAGVAGQCRGIAGDIAKASRTQSQQGRNQCRGTGAGRVEHDQLVAPAGPGAGTGVMCEIGTQKLGIGDAIELRVVARALDRCGIAFDTGYLRHPSGQRQGKVSDSAKQVEQEIRRLRLQQVADQSDQRTVHGAVGLGKLPGLELQPDVRAAGVVAECFEPFWPADPAIVHDADLQLHRVGRAECVQTLQVVGMRCGAGAAKGECQAGFAARKPCFLQPAGLFEFAEQLCQRREQRACRCHQNRTGMQRLYTPGPLAAQAERGRGAALATFDGQAGSRPVLPGLARYRVEPAPWAQPRDSLEGVAKMLLPDLELGHRRKMLQIAAAAATVVGAGRRDPLRRGVEDLQCQSLVITGAALADPVAHFLAGERTINEQRLARNAGHAASIMCKSLDQDRALLRSLAVQCCGPAVASGMVCRGGGECTALNVTRASLPILPSIKHHSAPENQARQEPTMPAKIICLLFYAAALLSLFVEMPATVEQILQYGTLALFAAHAVEIAVALRYIKLYEGPLLISMLLTLLFGFMHWMPYKKRAAQGSAG